MNYIRPLLICLMCSEINLLNQINDLEASEFLYIYYLLNQFIIIRFVMMCMIFIF